MGFLTRSNSLFAITWICALFAVHSASAGGRFPSGFQPSEACEEHLTIHAISNLPPAAVYSRLATEDKVLLLHKVSNQISRGAPLDPLQVTRIIRALNLLMSDESTDFSTFTIELEVIHQEFVNKRLSDERLVPILEQFLQWIETQRPAGT